MKILLSTFCFLSSNADRSPALKTNTHWPQKCLKTVLFFSFLSRKFIISDRLQCWFMWPWCKVWVFLWPWSPGWVEGYCRCYLKSWWTTANSFVLLFLHISPLVPAEVVGLLHLWKWRSLSWEGSSTLSVSNQYVVAFQLVPARGFY